MEESCTRGVRSGRASGLDTWLISAQRKLPYGITSMFSMKSIMNESITIKEMLTSPQMERVDKCYSIIIMSGEKVLGREECRKRQGAQR